MARGPVRRISLAPLFLGRAVYQFYASMLMAGLGMFAAMIVLYVLLLVGFSVAGGVGRLVTGLIGQQPSEMFEAALTLIGPFAFFSSGPFGLLAALITVLLFALIILVALPTAFAVGKSITEDRLFGWIAFAALVAWGLWPALDALVFGRSDVATPNEAFGVMNAIGMIPLLVIHLAAIVGLRAIRWHRLIVDAPRTSVRDLFVKYLKSNSGQINRAAAALAFGLFQAIWRGIGFAASILVLGFALVVMRNATTTIATSDEDFMLMVPLLGSFALAMMSAFWDFIRNQGFRLLNVAFLLNLLPVLLLGSFMNASTGTAPFEFASDASESVGTSTCLFLAIAFRRWLLAPLRNAFEVGRAALIRTASDITADATKAPILFLRSFEDDAALVATSFRVYTFAFGGKKSMMPLEEAVAEAVFARGPVIALSDPRSKQPPPLGAARDASTDEDWQPYVRSRIAEAQLVLVVVGKTANLAWELDQVSQAGALARTVFIVPKGYPFDRTIGAMSPSAAAEMGLSPVGERALGHGVRAIAFDSKKRQWRALTSLLATERGYADAVRIAAGMTLAQPSLRTAGA